MRRFVVLSVAILVSACGETLEPASPLDVRGDAPNVALEYRPARVGGTLPRGLAEVGGAQGRIQTFLTSESPFTPGILNQGWWSPDFPNSDRNANYITGSPRRGVFGYRNFFTFDLSSLATRAASAELVFRRGCSSESNEALEDYTLYDVSTPVATLNFNSGLSRTIFDDLGAGVILGGVTIAGSDDPDATVRVPLNPDGISALNDAAPGFFSVGGRITSSDGDDFLFGCTGNTVGQADVVALEVGIGLDVAIDVKPGSDPNTINLRAGNGVISVAILTTSDFDARTVDHTTLLFAGAPETHVARRSNEVRRHVEDVDGDGDLDLVLHVRVGDTDLDRMSTQGTLSGRTYDGTPILGTDAIRVIGSTGGPEPPA